MTGERRSTVVVLRSTVLRAVWVSGMENGPTRLNEVKIISEGNSEQGERFTESEPAQDNDRSTEECCGVRGHCTASLYYLFTPVFPSGGSVPGSFADAFLLQRAPLNQLTQVALDGVAVCTSQLHGFPNRQFASLTHSHKQGLRQGGELG
jgi:hypothetical protein